MENIKPETWAVLCMATRHHYVPSEGVSLASIFYYLFGGSSILLTGTYTLGNRFSLCVKVKGTNGI